MAKLILGRLELESQLKLSNDFINFKFEDNIPCFIVEPIIYFDKIDFLRLVCFYEGESSSLNIVDSIEETLSSE